MIGGNKVRVEIKRVVPLRKHKCLYCGEERTLYDLNIKQIYDSGENLKLCKKCLMELSYRLNEIIAETVKWK